MTTTRYVDQIKNIDSKYLPRLCGRCGWRTGQCAVYHWGYFSLCYSCAVEKYHDHHFFCVVCGQIFENKYVCNYDLDDGRWGIKYPLCKRCRKPYSKERHRVHMNNSRSKKLGLVANLTLQEWLSILDEHDRKCVYCDKDFVAMDHKVAISNGGGTTKSNVVPACTSCNSSKHNGDSATAD